MSGECYLAKTDDEGTYLWWTGDCWSYDKAERFEFSSSGELERHCRESEAYKRGNPNPR
jgi:hypothetical protein